MIVLANVCCMFGAQPGQELVMDGHRYKCTKYTKKGIHLDLVGKNVGRGGGRGSGGGGGGGGRDEGGKDEGGKDEGGKDAHGKDAHGKDEGKGLICTPADLPLQDVDICFCSMAAQKDDAAEKNNADETPVEDANSEKTPASKKKANDEKKDGDETPDEKKDGDGDETPDEKKDGDGDETPDEKKDGDETPVEDANSEETPASKKKANDEKKDGDETSVEEDDSDDDPDYKPAKTPEKTSKKKRTEKTPEKTKKRRKKKKWGRCRAPPLSGNELHLLTQLNEHKCPWAFTERCMKEYKELQTSPLHLNARNLFSAAIGQFVKHVSPLHFNALNLFSTAIGQVVKQAKADAPGNGDVKELFGRLFPLCVKVFQIPPSGAREVEASPEAIQQLMDDNAYTYHDCVKYPEVCQQRFQCLLPMIL